jgi:hypothetical protein
MKEVDSKKQTASTADQHSEIESLEVASSGCLLFAIY